MRRPCTAVNKQLESEGFRVDVKAVPENVEFPFSLHAPRRCACMREMKDADAAVSRAGAGERGRYDGWQLAR